MRDMLKIQKIFAERLTGFLQEKNWSLTKFSKMINIPRTTIGSWLLFKRAPQIDSLYEIAEFFGCSIDYLVGREKY